MSRRAIDVLTSSDKLVRDMSHVAWQGPPGRAIPVAQAVRQGEGAYAEAINWALGKCAQRRRG